MQPQIGHFSIKQLCSSVLIKFTEMDSMKKQYQIRCSHYELELFKNENRITCVICGKNWDFLEERGYSHKKQAYSAERN